MTTTTTGSSKYSVQYTRDCIYLAGMFDAGLPTQVVQVPVAYSEPGYKVRVSKTSTDSAVPLMIRQKVGAGNLFQTSRGTRWSIESKKDVKAFIEMIEPYSTVRQEELRLLRRILEPEEGDLTPAMLAEELKKLRSTNKIE